MKEAPSELRQAGMGLDISSQALRNALIKRIELLEILKANYTTTQG